MESIPVFCLENGEEFASIGSLNRITGVSTSYAARMFKHHLSVRAMGLHFVARTDAPRALVAKCANCRPMLWSMLTSKAYMDLHEAMKDERIKRARQYVAFHAMDQPNEQSQLTIERTLPRCGCGGVAKLEVYYGDTISYRIVCTVCGMATPWTGFYKEPATKWCGCFGGKQMAKGA